MRSKATHGMHNKGRFVVGMFLTHDKGLPVVEFHIDGTDFDVDFNMLLSDNKVYIWLKDKKTGMCEGTILHVTSKVSNWLLDAVYLRTYVVRIVLVRKGRRLMVQDNLIRLNGQEVSNIAKFVYKSRSRAEVIEP
jgi:hypothetical protein